MRSSTIVNKSTSFQSEQLDMSDYVLAFSVYSNEKILVSDKPPRLGGKVEEIDANDFGETMNFNWCDHILIPRKIRDVLWKSNDKKNQPLLESAANKQAPRIVIADIDEKIGKGVFLAMDSEIIIAGTIVGIFPGKVETYKDRPQGCFGISIAACEWLGKASINNAFVDGSLLGNYTRYINDLPLEFELDRKRMTKEENEKIATANLLQFVQNHDGIPVVYVVASRDILPGEQLGYSYDISHWNYSNLKGIKRCVYDLDGKLLGEFKDGCGNLPAIIKNLEYKPSGSDIANRTSNEVLGFVSNNHLNIPSNFNEYNNVYLRNVNFVINEIIKDTRYEKHVESLHGVLSYINDSANNFASKYNHVKNYIEKIKSGDEIYLLKQQVIYLAKQREATYQKLKSSVGANVKQKK